MPETTVVGAIESASPDGKTEVNPSRGGDHAQKTSEQLLSEYKAETQRKAEEIKALKAEQAEMKAALAELKAKAESGDLSKKDERKMEVLESEIEAAAEKLRGDPEAKPWIKIAKEEMSEVMVQHQIELGNEFLEDRAAELGMEPKDLAKEISAFAFKYQDKRPERRNALAFKDWQKEQSRIKALEAKEKELKEREEKEKAFREGKGRIPRQADKDQKFQEAKKEDRLGMLSDLIG